MRQRATKQPGAVGPARACGPGAILAFALCIATSAHAQTGVSDDRVVLPGGPGSLGGVGENVALSGNMGTMRYAVPIEVPTGFPGMTPDVSLSYDSGRGGGVIAYAWDLPAPSIERNTVRGLPRYDTDDEFVTSDAEQLVRVADDPPTYRARFERGFKRFTWLDAGDGGGGYWRVELPDGRVEWYGATPDGSVVDAARVASADGGQVFRYHLVERRDPFGHRLTYDYSKSGLNVLLQRIGWVYTDAAEPTFSVTVQHEPRADATGGAEVSDARGGFDVRITTRVAAINVFARGERIRRYALSYRPYADTGGFTHLRRVETFGHRDGRLPIVHDFEYTEGLGPGCGAGECLRPFVVEMGQTGLDLSSGRGTFIDINGDGLPDLLHTPLDEPHQFYLAIPAVDGSSRFAAQPVISAFGANFLLDNGYVQVFDANGDGFADLVNARSGEVLFNRGEGDWDRLGALTDVAPLPDFAADLGEGFGFGEDQLQSIRFLDYDNDKRIDVLRSTRQDTTVYRNLGPAGFAAVGGVEPLGRGIAEDGVEFADMNGDGLLDPVWVRPDAITYRVHLGRGRWGDEVAVPIALEADAVPFASLQDLNGDGLSDLVVVRGRSIQYAANQAGDTFVDFAPLGPGDVDGDLPERREGVQVLYADMNANGSTDVVWVDRQGTVTYLDLFPVRPNLVSRITNGLGQTIDVEYETSAQQVARSAEAWPYPLPFSMQVVRRLDVWDAHGDVHDVTEASYRDGFYDGVERQFRGYGVVERRMLGDASREAGLEQTVWDLGVDDVYRHGLPIERTLRSDDRLLWSEAMTYADCPLDGVPPPAALERPVRFTCLDRRERRVVEGGAEADAVTLATTYAYDGYGNPTGVHDLGDVDAEGDEWRVETTFAAPAERWLLRAPVVRRAAAAADGPAREQRWYYDGEPFVGLPAGQVDQGKRTRVTRAISADGVIEVERNRFDAHGNVVETLDGLGAPGARGHRRFYAYDPDGLHVVQTDIELEAGALRRESRYDPLWDAVVESTAWMRVVDGAVRSARRSHFFTYDEFGRLASRVLPGGDTVQNPTEVFVYELGSPRSRVVTRRRSVVGGQLDLQSVRCVDGRGRTYETRTEIADGAWQVDGYAVFDPRGDVAAQYQPYLGADGDCADGPPADGLAERRRYDAQGRPLAIEHPDGDERGEPSVRRFEYAPLLTRAIDELGSPVTRLFDGLGRLVAVERALGAMSGGTDFAYDALGHLATVTDPLGVAKVQTFDRAGRVLRVEDVDRGTLEFAWDAAGNLVERRDARGVALRQTFDAANRLVARGAADDAETIWIWDEDPACDPALCTNTANQVAAVAWPGGGEQRGFDARGRPLARARTLGEATYRVDFAYDNADRPVQVDYPGGARVSRRFDGAGRETRIEGVAPRIEWDARGLLAEVEYADGTVGTWGYDARRQLVERRVEGDATLLDLAYSYDRRGVLTGVRDGADAVTVDSDAWRRVTSYEAAEGTLDLRYDLGDRVEAIDGPPALAPGALTYADGTHRVTAVGGVAYAHDAAGLLTQRGDAALDWDAEARLIAAGDARFGYGAAPERLQRFEGDSRADFAADDFEVRDGVGTLYVRLGLDRIARREDVDLAVEVLGDPNDDGRVDAGDAWLDADDRPARLLASARRLLVETGAADTLLHADRVGSLVLATAGDVVGEQRFTPFGRTLWSAGHVDRHGFQGQALEAGLWRHRGRALDPVSAQWTAPDPAFDVATPDAPVPEGLTPYAFVANQPLDRRDPTGLLSVPVDRPKAAPTPRGATARRAGGSDPRAISVDFVGTANPQAISVDFVGTTNPQAISVDFVGTTNPQAISVDFVGRTNPAGISVDFVGITNPAGISVDFVGRTNPAGISVDFVGRTNPAGISVDFVGRTNPAGISVDFVGRVGPTATGLDDR